MKRKSAQHNLAPGIKKVEAKVHYSVYSRKYKELKILESEKITCKKIKKTTNKKSRHWKKYKKKKVNWKDKKG